MAAITPFLWFADEAEQAAEFYVSVFPNSRVTAVREGHIGRDTRFGYVALAEHPRVDSRDFIRSEKLDGRVRVELSLRQAFDLCTGEPLDPLS